MTSPPPLPSSRPASARLRPRVRATVLLLIAVTLLAGRPATGSSPSGATESLPAADAAGAGSLTVVVEGLESDAGTVAFALYGSAESFSALTDPVRKGRLEIRDRACRWRAEDLPAGDYVLSVYHDADGDGELDKGAFGIPTEPYGFSNDARGVTGPPSWDKARFRHDGTDRELRVRVR